MNPYTEAPERGPDKIWVERTCNAQVTGDRNWFVLQALELVARTIRSKAASFALHALFAYENVEVS